MKEDNIENFVIFIKNNNIELFKNIHYLDDFDKLMQKENEGLLALFNEEYKNFLNWIDKNN